MVCRSGSGVVDCVMADGHNMYIGVQVRLRDLGGCVDHCGSANSILLWPPHKKTSPKRTLWLALSPTEEETVILYGVTEAGMGGAAVAKCLGIRTCAVRVAVKSRLWRQVM